MPCGPASISIVSYLHPGSIARATAAVKALRVTALTYGVSSVPELLKYYRIKSVVFQLRESQNVVNVSKIYFEEILHQKSATENTVQALDHLSKILKQHYNKPVFIIIDEYDVPMARTLNIPAYRQTREMIEKMLSYVCKTNENTKGVILS